MEDYWLKNKSLDTSFKDYNSCKKERGKISYDFNANNLEGMKALCLKRKKNSFHQASHRVDKESFTLNISNILLGTNSSIKVSRIM